MQMTPMGKGSFSAVCNQFDVYPVEKLPAARFCPSRRLTWTRGLWASLILHLFPGSLDLQQNPVLFTFYSLTFLPSE